MSTPIKFKIKEDGKSQRDKEPLSSHADSQTQNV